MSKPTFTVSLVPHEKAISLRPPSVQPFAIVQDGLLVMEDDDVRGPHFMAFMQRRHAEKRLDEVRRQLPEAEIIDRTQ